MKADLMAMVQSIVSEKLTKYRWFLGCMQVLEAVLHLPLTSPVQVHIASIITVVSGALDRDYLETDCSYGSQGARNRVLDSPHPGRRDLR